MKRLFCILAMLLCVSYLSQTVAGAPATVNYGTVSLSGGFQSGHFNTIWDLTRSDMTISFTVDLTGMVDDFGGGAHAWSEFGARSVGYGDFNPTWMTGGAGVWLATDYDWTVNTFDPDPGAPTQDIDDKFILQRGGGMDESFYNLPGAPPVPWNNHRIWYDRDGVDPWQAMSPLMVDGGTYNTGGTYDIVITLHATSPTSGTAYMTINGLAQGFEVDGNWNTMELTPAGMTFTGDMTQMQVFYGLYGYGAVHSVVFSGITVTGFVEPPQVITEPATDVTRTSATLNGLIQDSGGDTCEWRFDWWSADMFASCAMSGALTTGQSFQLPISGLKPETLYYFRAYARNAGGEGRGDIQSFTTLPQCEGTLLLLDPNGGQQIVAGSTYEITWQTTGTIYDVRLEYSADNGATWTDVNTVANTGSYAWEVPDVNNSQQCLVRVSGAACPQVNDTSDNVFTIYRCCLLYDLNHDCIVNELDRDLLLSEWLQCGDPFDPNCP